MVGVARRPAAGRPGREPHLAQAEVEGGVELGERALDVVEVAQGDAEQPRVGGAERGHRPVVGAVARRSAASGSAMANSGAHNDEYTTWCSKPSRSRARAALGRVDGAEGGVPLRPSLDEVVAQLDKRSRSPGGLPVLR